MVSGEGGFLKPLYRVVLFSFSLAITGLIAVNVLLFFVVSVAVL